MRPHPIRAASAVLALCLSGVSPAHAVPSSPRGDVSETFSGHGPLIVVRSLSVPTGSHESKTDLYGSLTLTNGWQLSSGTAFQQGEYDSTPVTGLAPLRPHGVTGSAVRITVDLWDHWEPVFISDTHIRLVCHKFPDQNAFSTYFILSANAQKRV